MPFDNFITNDLVETYQNAIDAMLANMGKDVLVMGPATSSDCPNCNYSPLTKRSGGIYNSGNPNTLGGPLHKIFVNGTTCGVCRGRGRLSFDPQTVTMKCLIEWAPKEYESMPAGANIRQSNNRIKLKTYASNATTITNATKIMVPHTYVNSTWSFKGCKLMGEIAARGLKYNRYIEFLCEVI